MDADCGAQSGHSRGLPVCLHCGPPADTWHRLLAKAGQDLLWSTFFGGAQTCCPVITSQTGLISHRILATTKTLLAILYSEKYINKQCGSQVGVFFENRFPLWSLCDLNDTNVKWYLIQPGSFVTASQTNCHPPINNLGMHCS